MKNMNCDDKFSIFDGTVEYNFDTMINGIYRKYGIKLPNIMNAYKRTYINLESKKVNFNSSIGSLILKNMNEKIEYSYNILRSVFVDETDDIQLYKIKIYLLNYAYIDFYDLEENLKTMIYDKYYESSYLGYEPNYYIKMHLKDIAELERMNLLDNFCEMELEIMGMICKNEQKNINFLNKTKKLTR